MKNRNEDNVVFTIIQGLLNFFVVYLLQVFFKKILFYSIRLMSCTKQFDTLLNYYIS